MSPKDDPSSWLRLLEAEQDPSARNALALRLAEAETPGLDEVLVRLIARPDLVNSRGTLIHALGYCDCSTHLGLLVDLILTGNWEVAHETLQVLETIDRLDGEAVDRAFEKLRLAQTGDGLEQWRVPLLDELAEHFD